MSKIIKTKTEALKYLESENIGVHKGYTLKVVGRMYNIELGDTKDLIKWCNEDKQNSEEEEY